MANILYTSQVQVENALQPVVSCDYEDVRANQLVSAMLSRLDQRLWFILHPHEQITQDEYYMLR